MNSKIYKRIRLETEYILKENLTVREIAKKINVSKSTVHKDLHERLFDIDKKAAAPAADRDDLDRVEQMLRKMEQTNT